MENVEKNGENYSSLRASDHDISETIRPIDLKFGGNIPYAV
jgi:hypothetical protein